MEEFKIDDLKRYYEAIDRNIDINEELHGSSNKESDEFLKIYIYLDFHDVYLILHYEINGQSTQFQCNNNQPMVCLCSIFLYSLTFLFLLASTQIYLQSMDAYKYANPFQVRNISYI